MDAVNTPLLSAGTLPIALLCSVNPPVRTYYFERGVMHYRTHGQAPVFVEVRGAVTYIEVQKKPDNYKPVKFDEMPLFKAAVKPIRKRAA